MSFSPPPPKKSCREPALQHVITQTANSNPISSTTTTTTTEASITRRRSNSNLERGYVLAKLHTYKISLSPFSFFLPFPLPVFPLNFPVQGGGGARDFPRNLFFGRCFQYLTQITSSEYGSIPPQVSIFLTRGLSVSSLRESKPPSSFFDPVTPHIYTHRQGGFVKRARFPPPNPEYQERYIHLRVK